MQGNCQVREGEFLSCSGGVGPEVRVRMEPACVPLVPIQLLREFQVVNLGCGQAGGFRFVRRGSGPPLTGAGLLHDDLPKVVPSPLRQRAWKIGIPGRVRTLVA